MERLGLGGTSSAYAVIDRRTKQELVMKVFKISENENNDQGYAQCFEQEKDILRTLEGEEEEAEANLYVAKMLGSFNGNGK